MRRRLRNGGDGDPDDRPLAVTDPNVFRYRNCGYDRAEDNAVRYVSADGRTKVLAEVFRLFEDDEDEETATACEQRFRIKVECAELWVTINCSVGTAADGRRTEVVVGQDDVVENPRSGDDDDGPFAITRRSGADDGTAVAITGRSDDDDGPFAVTRRSDADGTAVAITRRFASEWRGDAVIVAEAYGNRISVDFDESSSLVCEVCVSDGTRIRVLSDPAIQYFRRRRRRRRSDETTGEPAVKYVACRRDLSGYEFVDGGDEAATGQRTDHTTSPPATVVRTLTRNHADGRAADMVDDALAGHWETVCALADRLNAQLPAEAADDEGAAPRDSEMDVFG